MLKNKRNSIYVCSLPNVRIGNNNVENVVKFKYFEKQSTNKNCIQEEMKSRLRPRDSALTPFFKYFAFPFGIRTREKHSIPKYNL
jgi:hypothetical protein